ncbi:MAG TPA: hypothetical protein VLB05_15750 [Dongiaceae bacterium]|jgi:hypothetical protein|nr:hypothetical protein [Dongiaceae bacterium]
MVDNPAAKLWLIEPAADPDDLIWQDRPVWAEVVVAAESPAFARLAAEEKALSPDWIPIGNESASRRAGLNDEQLYHVRPLPAERRPDFPANPRPGEVLLMRDLRPARRS